MGNRSSSGSKRFLLAFVLAAANLALWLAPGPVVEYIARDRPTLLGRYSVERLTGMIALAIFSAAALYLAFAPAGARKKRSRQLAAAFGAMLLALGVGEAALRLRGPTPRYIVARDHRLRPAHYRAKYPFRDEPEARRSYPHRPPGFEPDEVTLEIDEHGFRNPEGIVQADLVCIGDSFTEAPQVRDDELWTSRLAESLGVSVYNMGTSGENPGGYLYKVEHLAFDLHPRTVLMMLCEANDFRGFKPHADEGGLRGSRLRVRLRQWLVDAFGPLLDDAAVAAAERIDWLPVGVPSVKGTTYYAFSPRKVGELFRTEEEIRAQRGWCQARDAIRAAAKLCREKGVELVIVYAPAKPHVVLPLVEQRLDPDVLLDFTKIQNNCLPAGRRDMTDGRAFLAELLADLDVEENATRSVCGEEGVRFLSLTEPLREAIGAGCQAFFTYDQHWTPLGHRVVADALADRFRE